ncbi:MAG TPA: SDR family oxidoreductase [Kofleriaceae bacterium]|nr:SDR family oxidoreductase [Kofleriaceae bacterium]
MIERAIIFGSSSGVGRATATALAQRGTKVWGVARHAREATPGVHDIIGDATDPAVVERVLAEADPDLVVVAVGIQPRMGTLDEHDWESFSAIWNSDVRAAFHVGQLTLRRPLRAGATVVIVSSGAGLHGSALSGGYAGAKRMQMFLADYLQQLSAKRNLGIRYVSVVPRQFIAGTVIADTSASAYAAAAGITVAKFMERFEVPLEPSGVASAILGIADGNAPDGAILGLTGARGLEKL